MNFDASMQSFPSGFAFLHPSLQSTLIKKKIKLSSYIGKFRVEQLQSHIWLTASSYMGKSLRISSYIRKPFLIYNFATAPLWISLYIRKILFYFLSVQGYFFRRANKQSNLSPPKWRKLCIPARCNGWQHGLINQIDNKTLWTNW